MYKINSYEYIDNNCNETILFLHGWGCNLSYMLPLAKKIYNANSLIIDLPGFGKNSPFQSAKTIYDYMDIIYDFVTCKDYNISYIVGHSFGGKLSILLANKLKIKVLFLFSPSIYNKKRHIDYYLKIYLYKFLKKLNVKRKILNLFGSEDYKSLSDVMKKTMSNVINADITKELKTLNSSIILFFGKNDKITPPYLGKKIKKNSKDCELFILNGDHFAYIQNSNYISILLNRVINLTYD